MKRLELFTIGLVACLCLFGCDAKYWPGFGGAVPRPDARVLIELPEPMTVSQLYPSFVEVVSQSEFIHFFGLEGSPKIEELFSGYYEGTRYLSSLTWAKKPYQDTSFVPRITFSIKSNNREEPDQTKRDTNLVTFIFRKGSSEKFTKEEWQEFFRFYRDILPQVFEDTGARLSISRHPALFTDKELLLEIREETDFEIPERYLEIK